MKSKECEKYGFNSTSYPNYIGMATVDQADLELGIIFNQIKFCTIKRSLAEPIGCAIYVPLCIDGKRIPPCSEDCQGKNF